MSKSSGYLSFKISKLFHFGSNYWQLIVFVLCLTAFILFELPFLNRPFYWDEAWSYASAVNAMYEKGPSLMPGTIHEYLYRGHPTFFYFLTTLWMKIFGSSLLCIHSLFLIISCSLLSIVFLFCKTLFNTTVGLLASIILMVTPLFLSQATFMLPEVLLALLTLLTLFFYLKGKIIYEVIFGSLLVLTKESGMVLICVLTFHFFVSNLFTTKNYRDLLKVSAKSLLHALPLFAALVFFILQKIKMGWFLYPEHLGMMTFNVNQIIQKFINISRTVFQLQGRIILLLISVAGLVILITRKKLTISEKRIISVSFMFIVAYILFSAANFYTVRYILSVLPLFFIISAFILDKIFNKIKYFPFIVLGCFVIITLQNTVKPKGVGDDTVHYIDMVRVHESVVNYCENYILYDKSIQTSFLMLYNLKDPFMGYLKNKTTFKNVSTYDDSINAEIVIASSIETPGDLVESLRKNPEYFLAKRFEQNLAWCEIYIKNHASN